MGINPSKNHEIIDKITNQMIMVYAGTLTEDRGLEIIKRTIKQLPGLDLPIHFYLIIGNEEVFRDISELIDNHQLNNYVTLNVNLEYNHVQEIMGKSHIGISLLADKPYFRHSPPQKIFEYMNNGLAIIANNIITHNYYIKRLL
jgi:glycosyltransferase involved in cell wall biosynthesis